VKSEMERELVRLLDSIDAVQSKLDRAREREAALREWIDGERGDGTADEVLRQALHPEARS